jgi:beta-lactamase superfamily II metal-dependent hydrolase
MQFKIHDVGHGSCVVAVGPEGHRLMLDCGYSIDRPWFPSIHYSGLEIQTLMITNLDEDHVEDLPDLWRKVRINGIFSNPTIDAAAL